MGVVDAGLTGCMILGGGGTGVKYIVLLKTAMEPWTQQDMPFPGTDNDDPFDLGRSPHRMGSFGQKEHMLRYDRERDNGADFMTGGRSHRKRRL